ncbi:MAG TPA: TIGR02996 domain-containing protein [Gemmataceae bacterium]|jgi:uncharacterized protein (TIGR02996 family)
MTHDEAFIQAIREAPHDDTPRLIYADWLEEHGQADRADFIRIQCQLTRMTDPHPGLFSGFFSLKAREEGLLRRNWNEWVCPLREIVGPRYQRYGMNWLGGEYHPDGREHFRRGFVDRLSLHAESFIRHAERLSRLTALRELSLWGAGQCAAELANVTALSGLSILAFVDYYDAPLMARDAMALASSPFLHGISRLFLGYNSLGDEGVESLVRAPWLVGVHFLDLTDNGLSDGAARALAESPYLGNVRTLHVRKNAFSAAGISALTTSATLRRLQRLEYDPPTANGSSVGSCTP